MELKNRELVLLFFFFVMVLVFFMQVWHLNSTVITPESFEQTVKFLVQFLTVNFLIQHYSCKHLNWIRCVS